MRELEDTRIQCDVYRMLLILRSKLSRNVGGMDSLRLYRHSHTGTEALIDDYISTAVDAIESLVPLVARCDAPLEEEKYIREQLTLARQAFGRSAILLSGGATLGMKHIGVVKALWEAELLPRIISGASAGSIVAAVVCRYNDDEMTEVLTKFAHGDLDVFDEPGKEASGGRRLNHLFESGALYDPSHLQRVMKKILGDITFWEAYNRTRRILNIPVSNRGPYELPGLLNYITSPDVVIWSAVTASCAVPGIFQAASLQAKRPNGEISDWSLSDPQWIDGSVDNDLPMIRLSEMFNVNHFIVSQVNPHVVPFLRKEEIFNPAAPQHPSDPNFRLLSAITDLAREDIIHRLRILVELGIWSNELSKLISVLSQQYSGHINILPEISAVEVRTMLMNPTTDFMLDAQLCGERATWPKLSRIRNAVAIELALDRAVLAMEERVAFHESAVEAKRKASQGQEEGQENGGRPRRSSDTDEMFGRPAPPPSRLRRAQSSSDTPGRVSNFSSLPRLATSSGFTRSAQYPYFQPELTPRLQSLASCADTSRVPEVMEIMTGSEPEALESMYMGSSPLRSSPFASSRSLAMTPAQADQTSYESLDHQLLD